MTELIPIGKKKFNRIMIGKGPTWQLGEDEELLAEFLPLDMGAPRALYTEAQVKLQVDTWAPEAGVNDMEERTALRAFVAANRGSTTASRTSRKPVPEKKVKKKDEVRSIRRGQ